MITERILSFAVRMMNGHYLNMKPYGSRKLPPPKKGRSYMLYVHIPFCESLCPYCSFNRYPFEEKKAHEYFFFLKKEMRMLKASGYDFVSMYIGGGTPTILPYELADTIRLAKELFSIREVSAETNPNHLCPEYLEPLKGLVDRMSVGVQSFDDELLKRMCRYQKYGSAKTILKRISECAGAKWFKTLNVDMIFNFPTQTEKMLEKDLAIIRRSGCDQVTFYPLMASPSVEKDLRRSLGQVDYSREKRYYDIICRRLTGGKNPAFTFGSAWTFNKNKSNMIDEYVVDYEEYLAIGSGGMSFIDREFLVNTFHLDNYRKMIRGGRRSVYGYLKFSKRDHMRYRFMMQLFGLNLNKRQWRKDFGCPVQAGLPVEYLFLRACGGLREDREKITLTAKGRYLLVVMMRQFFVGVNTLRDEARMQKKELSW